MTAKVREHATCLAVGCRALLLPFGLFCDQHWPMVPSDLARLIGKHHRPGRRPSKVLQWWLSQAVTEVLYVQTEGHARPSPGSFEWDDTPPAAAGAQLALKWQE
jgi:hypothetical protein